MARLLSDPPAAADHLLSAVGPTRQAFDLGGTDSRSVMVSGLHDDEFILTELVDEAVFIGDAARPVAGEVVGEAFGLSDALSRVPRSFLDHAVDALEDRPFADPGNIVLPSITGEADLHAMSCCGSISSSTAVRPASASAMLRSSRSALAGDRSR